MVKTTRPPLGKQDGENVAEYLERLIRRYSRSRVDSLRQQARQWRVTVRRFRQRAVGGCV